VIGICYWGSRDDASGGTVAGPPKRRQPFPRHEAAGIPTSGRSIRRTSERCQTERSMTGTGAEAEGAALRAAGLGGCPLENRDRITQRWKTRTGDWRA
jgi:hypothetical protein